MKRLTEREQFERWIKTDCTDVDLTPDGPTGSGYEYFYANTQFAWDTWQARARLARRGRK